MSDPLPRISVILDATALREYARLNIHVLEVLHEVVDGGGIAGVPIAALAEARAGLADADDRARLDALLTLDSVELLDVIATDWLELAYWREVTGALEPAVAALNAVQLDAPVLTAAADVYGPYAPVIGIPA